MNMKKLLTIAFILLLCVTAEARNPWGSGFNQGDFNLNDNSVIFHEKDSDPAAPLKNEIALYAKDKAGTTTLYTKDFDSTVSEVGAGGGGSSEWTDAGTFLYSTETTDDVVIGGSTVIDGAKFGVDGDSDQVQFLIQAYSTQNELLAIFEDSAGNDQLTLSGDGGLTVNEEGNDVDHRFESSNDTHLLYLDGGTDTVTVGSVTSLGKFGVDGDADEIQAIIQGNATQTSDIFVVESSDGTDRFSVDNAGVATTGSIVTSGANSRVTGTNAEYIDFDVDGSIKLIDPSSRTLAIDLNGTNIEMTADSGAIVANGEEVRRWVTWSGGTEEGWTSANQQGLGGVASGSDANWTPATGYTCSNLNASVKVVPGAGAGWTISLNDDTSNTALTCDIVGDSDFACADSSNTVVIAADSRVHIQWDVQSGTPSDTDDAHFWMSCYET